MATMMVGRAARVLRFTRYAALVHQGYGGVTIVTNADEPPAYPGPGGYQSYHGTAQPEPPAYQTLPFACPEEQQQQPAQQTSPAQQYPLPAAL